MTRRKKFMSLFIALIVILGALFVFPITANAVNVTIGSSLFASANTKNMTIKGTENGIALRADQKEYAYTEWAATLPMNNFSIDFKIIDDNFEILELTFTSMYDESVSNYNISNPTEEQKKAMIQPEKIKNIITVSKESSGLKVNINGSESSIGSGDFTGQQFTVSYNAGNFKVTTKNGGEKNGFAINPFLDPAINTTDPSNPSFKDPIINNEATLKIMFPENSVKEVKKDTKDDKDETVEGAYTLLIEKISYLNINSSIQQEQSLKGTMVEDKSEPILKVNEKLLKTNEVYVPVNTQYKIPVSGIDIIKSLSNLSINATVNYYEPDSEKPGQFKLKDQNINNGLNFQVEKTTGYYLIEKITINDGTHIVSFENKEGSVKKIGSISLPIKVVGVEKTDETVNPGRSFKFNINETYAKLFESIELKGGSKNKITFPMPIVGSADFTAENLTGVRSYVNDALEDPNYISYKLWYRYVTDSAWTENSSFGLDFTASKIGTYYFMIEAFDRQGHRSRCETIISLTFTYDYENIPEITVNNFPDEITVKEKFTIPSSSVDAGLDSSPIKATALYYLNDDGTKGKRIEIKDGSFTPDEDELGKKFVVVYTARSGITGLDAIKIEREFTVVEASSNPKPFFEMNTLSIIFLCLGGASLFGIIVLLLIKPKEKSN